MTLSTSERPHTARPHFHAAHTFVSSFPWHAALL